MNIPHTILVTGGTGYIGSHTATELLQQGYEVVVVDNLANSGEDTIGRIEKITGKKLSFFRGDLCDKGLVEKLFQQYPIDAVIHFAAYKSVPESIDAPLNYYHNNLLSLLHLLEAAAARQIKYFVFSSSCTVYGQPETLPVKESDPLGKPESPYGKTKQMCEEILADTTATGKLLAVSLRYFNPIGAHESALIGELPLGKPNNLIPLVTQTAIGKRPVLQVFGDDYNTPDGSCIRDYIHVVDLAKAHVAALRYLVQKQGKPAYNVFNLGTGKGISVFEIINIFEKISGKKLNYTIVPRRSGDIEKIYADTSFANRELGWKAEKTLEEMVASAWKWEQHLAAETSFTPR